jgi:putative DNA primase/helicase
MSFDPKKQPQKVDDNWLSSALIRKIEPCNLFHCNAGTYLFENSWKLLEHIDLKNRVRSEIASLNEDRAAENLAAFAVNAGRVGSVTELLQMQIYRTDLRFNLGEPDTVGCANGDVVLGDGEWHLHEPKREHYRLCRIPHEYDPQATAPRFAEYLDEVFAPDEDSSDKKEFLLQMMGYALMTHCRHERFLILVGEGANGKSVALRVVEELVGPQNRAAVHPKLFGHSNHRAQLNQRLVNIVSESEQGGKLPAAELKALVSGETMTVDRKFEHPFEMEPFATFFWATNHMPHPSDYSDAIFRRAGILTFNRTFQPHERDTRLLDKLRPEMPGIMNMALQAYARAVSQGFTEPRSSRVAKDDWRLQSDAVVQWLAECEMAEGAYLGVKPCYDAFCSWSASVGLSQTPTLKTFSQRVERHGIEKRRMAQGVVFMGLKIAAAQERGL